MRTFIRNSIKYYMRKGYGYSGYSYSEALRHATADAKWWREQLS